MKKHYSCIYTKTHGDQRLCLQLPGKFNPLVTNGLSHPYYLNESIFVLMGIVGIFLFSLHFSMKML